MNIHSIASYIPDNYVDNVEQGLKFGETEDFIVSKIGAKRLPRKKNDQDSSDLAVNAVKNLFLKAKIDKDSFGVLVLVTQNGDGHNLPATSSIVHKKLGLPESVAVFDLSLGCSGYVYGLQVVKSLVQSLGVKSGVLVTADPYSKIINVNDRTTSLLFGDAATATLLTEEGEWELSRPRLGSDGKGYEHIMVRENLLEMNGRQVYNFAATKIPSEIKKLLMQENLQSEDIDSYCLHQGSAAIVEAIARNFPAVRHKFVIDLEKTGNTVSSSIPLLLEHQCENANNQRILISGFGVGLSWGSMVLYRKGIRK